MKDLILKELNMDYFREALIKFTSKAFLTIPEIDKPEILDIGCGTGIPTLELAKLSNGKITAIDIDDFSLNILNDKIIRNGLSERIITKNCSVKNLNFPKKSFDIIWAEGSIFTVGFENGLKNWKPILKENGFLAVHDDKSDYETKLQIIEKHNYILLDYFIIERSIWLNDFYLPFEKHLIELKNNYKNNPDAMLLIEKELNEVAMCKGNPDYCSSIFYIMQNN